MQHMRYLFKPRKSAPSDTIDDIIGKLVDRTEEVREMIEQFRLDNNLENLRYSGKPFYWVGVEKLRKLKQLCES